MAAPILIPPGLMERALILRSLAGVPYAAAWLASILVTIKVPARQALWLALTVLCAGESRRVV